MKYRKLRIAVTVLSLAALLLVVWWSVRDARNAGLIASVPHAFPALFWIGLAIAPWASSVGRFGPRAVLIATAVIAALLGMLV